MWPFRRKCKAFDLGGYGHKVICLKPVVPGEAFCARHLNAESRPAASHED